MDASMHRQNRYPSSQQQQQQQQQQQPVGPGALLDSSGASRAAAQAERERELWNNVAIRQQQQMQQQQQQQQGQKPPMHNYDRGMQQQQQQQQAPQQPHASQHWSPSPNLLSMRPSSVNTTIGSSAGNSSAPSSASPMSRLSDYGRSEDGGGETYGRSRAQMGTSPADNYRGIQQMQNNSGNNNGGYQQQQQQQQQLSPSFSGQQPVSPSPSPSPDPFNARSSDPARIQALVQVIHQLHEAGVSAKFLSQLGILYKQLHPTLFVKGLLKDLVDSAAASGLLVLSGPPGQQQVELTAQGQAIAKQWGRTHQLQNMHQLLEVRAFMVDAVVSEREARERENAANAANANASQRAPPLSASPGVQQWTVNAGVSSSSHNPSLTPLTQSFHSSSALSTQHSSPRHPDSQQSGQFSFLIEGDDSLDAHAPHLAQHRSVGLLGLSSSTRPSHLRDDSRDDHSDLGLGVTDEEDSQLLNSYNEVEMLRDMRDLYKNNSSTGVPVSSSNQHGMHSHGYSTTHSQSNSSQSSLVSSMQSSPHTSPNGGALLYHSHQTNGQKPPLIFHSQPQPLNNQQQQQQQQAGPQRTSPSYNAVGNQGGYNQFDSNNVGSSQLTPQPPTGDLSALQLLPPLPTSLEEKTFRSEKLKHLKYIFHFRVHPCLNFLQRGSCPFDNKNECFDYHSLKTRRRIPRIYNFSNGIFWNYNACRCQSIEKDMRCEKGEACRYAHCFEDSTQILTERGFMFRHELAAAELSGVGMPLLATYNRSTLQIEYQQAKLQSDGNRLYTVPASQGPFEMVDFAAPDDRAFWDGQSKSQAAASQSRSQHAALLVSSRHTMWAARDSSSKKFDTALAIDLFDQSEAPVAMQHVVEHGLSSAIEQLAPLCTELDVSPSQLGALSEIYGYFLGAGFMQHGPEGPRIAFRPVNDGDQARLQALCVEAGLSAEEVTCSDESGRQSVQILKASWVSYFVQHYGQTAVGTAHEIPLLWWARKLGKGLARRLIAGLRLADVNASTGADGVSVLSASSARFRDELMQIMLHAGFSAMFHPQASTEAATDHWRIEYNEVVASGSSSDALPAFEPAKDMVTRKHEGSLWCVTVPNGLIIARRAQTLQGPTESCASSRVVAASRALIVGNCKEEIAYHPSRYKTAACSYPLRSDGSCSRFGLHCAFSHGEHDIRKAIVLKQGMPHKLVEPAMHILQEQQKLVAALTGLTLAELNGFSLSGHNNSMAFGPGSSNSNMGGGGGGHGGSLSDMHRGHIPSGMHASSSNNGLSAWEQQLQQRNTLHNVQTNGLAGSSSSSTHLMMQSGDSMQQQQSQQQQYMDQRPGLGRPNSGTTQIQGGGPNSNLSLSMSVVNSGGGVGGGDLPYGTAPNSPTGGPSSSVNLDPAYLASLDPALYMCPPSELAADREHFLYAYKTAPCRNQTLACAKGDCQSYHFETKRRRNPRLFKYSYEACPAVKVPTEMSGVSSSWRRPSACRLGDACSLAHTRLEVMYHPLRWKHTLCEHFDERDRSTWQRCPWKRACAHAHSRLELEFAEASAMHDQGISSKPAGSHDFHDEHLSGLSGPPSMASSPHFGRLQQHPSYSGSIGNSGAAAGPSHDLDDSLPGVPAHLSALSREFVPGTDVSDDSMRSVLLRQEVAAQILRAQSGQLHPSSTAAGSVSPTGSSTQSQFDALRAENLALADRCARYEKEFYLFKIHIIEKDGLIKKMQWTLDSEAEEKRRLKAQLDTFKHELTQRFLQLTPQQQQQAIEQKPASASAAATPASGLSPQHGPPGGMSPHDLSKGDHTAVSLAESVLVSPNDDHVSPSHAHAADPHSPKSPLSAKAEGAASSSAAAAPGAAPSL